MYHVELILILIKGALTILYIAVLYYIQVKIFCLLQFVIWG